MRLLGANLDLLLSLENNEMSSASFRITAGDAAEEGLPGGGGGGEDVFDFRPQFERGAILS